MSQTTKMNALTLAVLRAIKLLTEQQHGQPPSLREIAKAVSTPRGKGASTATVQHRIQDLTRLGLVTRWPRLARSVVLTAKGKEEALIGSTESPIITCLTCKKRLPAREMPYLFGEQTERGGMGMCGDCAKAKPRRPRDHRP